MKYSLKNKQFRKRNNIFGDRRKDQISNQEYNHYLQEIEELAQSSEESKFLPEQNRNYKNSKIHQFINYENTIDHVFDQKKAEEKKSSLQYRPGKHGLSPNTKPVSNISKTASLKISETIIEPPKPKKLQIHSQIVNIRFLGKKKSDSEDETKEILKKIYSIIMRNNSRINQIEALLLLMMQNGKLLIRQTNKGVQKVLIVQEKINLFLNTMRSVYENLRICKLKQQNLELYIKQQNKQKQNYMSRVYENDNNQKHSRPRYKLDDLKKQITLSVEDPQSKELISLVDYESNYSQSQSIDFQQHQPEFRRKLKQQFTLSLTEHEILQNKESTFRNINQQAFKKYSKIEKPVLVSKSNLQQQRLSPFDANRIISYSTHQGKVSRQFHNESRLKTFNRSSAEHFQTFRTNNNTFHLDKEQEKLKNWLRKLGLNAFKCWLDELGCLRRPNMTYVFYENGQVINLNRDSFNQLVEQGQLVPVFDKH